MAKRFIDTDLFRKPLMRGLKAPYKALWVYLLCECDHAGIWDVEIDVAAMRLGLKVDVDDLLAMFGGAVVQIDDGRKWYIPDFVTFQYGELNPNNRVHASVLAHLAKYGIDPTKEAPSKPLTSPLQGAKAKDKDKVKDKEEGPRELKWPVFAGDRCKAKWAEFVAYRIAEKGKRYKTAETEQRALDLALKFFPTGPGFVAALDHAMAKTWEFPVDPAKYEYPKVEGVPAQAPPPILNANGKPQQLKPWVN